MKNNFEQYLKDHRSDLDVDQPDEEMIWEGIKKDLGSNQKKKLSLYVFSRSIAAALVLLVAGYTMFFVFNNDQDEKPSLAAIDHKLAAKEQTYIELVGLKEKEAFRKNGIQDVIIIELCNELKIVEEIYIEALSDLRKNGYNEKTIHIIFDTYEKKIDILEKIIIINENEKRHENNDNKKTLL